MQTKTPIKICLRPFAMLAACFGGMLAAMSAKADVAVSTGTVTAQISSIANLSLGSTNVTFPNANPATVTSIPANENGIAVTVNARTSLTGTVTLTVIALGDLTSGAETIGINNVTWSTSGSGFQSGTLSKVSAATVGSWVGPGTHTGSVSFFLANSFAYATGTYTATLTYTLTAL